MSVSITRSELEGDPLALLARLGGYYECPRNPNGSRRGPLVGYAGKYQDGGRELQHVGDVYANFAKAEQQGRVLSSFALQMFRRLCDGDKLSSSAGFCGAPEGGKALAVALSLISGQQYIFPEKRITQLASKDGREESEMVFDRHVPEPGTSWWVVEDVCNNFSTPNKLGALFAKYGASIKGIVCFLNRSLEVGMDYPLADGTVIPVVALVRKPILQYRQDDSSVATDVAAGNIVWKPKNDWSRLAPFMKA